MKFNFFLTRIAGNSASQRTTSWC